MPRRMKVFRTPAGFHDAYVAAPSRKAALAAWGADVDLFARGAAEEVTDPALTEAPLAAPGTIVRLSRGTAEEHLATAPAPRRRRAGVPKPPATKQATRPERAKRPSRAALDDAEATLAAAEERHRTEQRALERRRAALDKEERAAQQRWRREATTLEEAVADARSRYDAALAAWRE